MTGQCGLAHLQGVDQLTDTEIGPEQRSENPNPCGIRDRLSKLVQLLHNDIGDSIPSLRIFRSLN